MPEHGRVVTANLPEELALRLDEVAARLDRSKSWILKQALIEWLADEDRRHDLTLEALRDFDDGRSYTQQEASAHFEQRRRDRESNR